MVWVVAGVGGVGAALWSCWRLRDASSARTCRLLASSWARRLAFSFARVAVLGLVWSRSGVVFVKAGVLDSSRLRRLALAFVWLAGVVSG